MVYKLTQARLKGKEILRRSDFQRVIYDLQMLNPLYREKIAEVLQDSREKRVYYIVNNILFFKN